MTRTIENLLIRLREGDVRPGDLEAARALVAADHRVPDEVRAEVFLSPPEVSSDAAGVLALLGCDDLGEVLVDGLRAELASLAPLQEVAVEGGESWEPIRLALVEGLTEAASVVDVAEHVMHRLPLAAFAHGSLVGSAVAGEAGSVEVADRVSSDLGMSAVPVAEAVRVLGGSVDLADAVLAEVGFERSQVAEAVRAEAGAVDVSARVMSELGLVRAATALPKGGSVVSPTVQLPAPANTRWGFAGFALAAALLVSVVVARLASPVPGTIVVAVHGSVFAHAGEVVIEDLEYGVGVQVIQTEGDEGAVILWVDEEA
jgi:hypothetical protein